MHQAVIERLAPADRRQCSRHFRQAFFASLAVAIMLGCAQEPTAPPTLALTLIAVHDLDLSEPSGLTIDETGTALWTVANQGIKKIDLTGERTGSVDYDGDDVEGIAYDPGDGTLWIVEEKLQEIVHLQMDGTILSRQRLALGGDVNSGLEGICLDDGGSVFALKEKDPALFLAVGSDQSIRSREMAFADDCSGIAYNAGAGTFWVLSDQDQKVYEWSEGGGVLAEFPLPFPKAEGIAFDEAASLIYIVSDSENRLYVYQLGG